MTAGTRDRFAAARSVADAVLYEGYVLYPYRASSRKNQVRWQFGVLAPRAFSEAEGSERWFTRTECLVQGAPDQAAVLSTRIRCLHVQHRRVEAARPAAASAGAVEFRPVERLDVDGQVYLDWDEAVDRSIDLSPLDLVPGHAGTRQETFVLEAGQETEMIGTDPEHPVGRLVRRREQVSGRARVDTSLAPGGSGLIKVAITVENATEWAGATTRRDEVIGHSLVAVHVMLAIDGGRFVSLLDPPESARLAVASCHSEAAFPVLIGDGEVVLSSPIILYDNPEVAPESPGDLYDSTEIDEILALRVITLTDAERSEARGTDPRAAAIIDRCDAMTPDMWGRLHGEVRSLGSTDELIPQPDASPDAVPWWDPTADAAVDPWSDSVIVGGVSIAKGSAVRLRPSRRSDAQDLFFAGQNATVAGVFRDVDGSEQVAVTIDDDPATEELAWQGRYLFFHPEEVEPLTGQDATP